MAFFEVVFLTVPFLATGFLLAAFFVTAFLLALVLRLVPAFAGDVLPGAGFGWWLVSAGNVRMASLTASRTICGNSAAITADTVRRTSSATVADNACISNGAAGFWLASATIVSTT